MRDNETVGLVTIIVGLVLVIGAVRGTWKKIFQDVISTGGSSGSSGGSNCSGFDAFGHCIPIPTGPITGIPFSPLVNQTSPSTTAPGQSFAIEGVPITSSTNGTSAASPSVIY